MTSKSAPRYIFNRNVYVCSSKPMYREMFIEALFVIFKTKELPKYKPTVELTNKLWYLRSRIVYSKDL